MNTRPELRTISLPFDIIDVLYIDANTDHLHRRSISPTQVVRSVPKQLYWLLDSQYLARIDLRPNTTRAGIAAWIGLDAVGTKPMNTCAATVIGAITGEPHKPLPTEATRPRSVVLWEPNHLYAGHVVVTGIAHGVDHVTALPEHVFDQVAAYTIITEI